MTDRIPKRIPRWFPLAWIALLLTVFYWPVLVEGETFFAFDILGSYLPWSSHITEMPVNNLLISDPVNQVYPVLKHIHDCRQQNLDPYWMPQMFAGAPLPAGAFTRYGSPLVAPLLYLFSPTGAHDCLLALALAGAAAFLYRYLRFMRLERTPALIGATAWMFNGFVMVWFEFELMPILAAATPGLLLGIEKWIRRRRVRDALIITLAGGIGITSGFAHVFIYVSLFVGAYAVVRVIQERTALLALPPRAWLGPILAGVLLVGMAAPFAVSHVMLIHGGQRQGFSFEQLWFHTGRLPARYLPTLLMPDLYGSPLLRRTIPLREAPTQMYNNYNELCIYAGIGTLTLALLSLGGMRRHPPIRFFAIAAVAVLAMAMGSWLYYPLWRWVPGLRLTSATRILFLFGFCLSVLAAFGASLWYGAELPRWWRYCVSLLLLGAMLGLAGFVSSDAGLHWLGEPLTRMDVPLDAMLLQARPALPTLLVPLVFALAAAGLLLLSERMQDKKARHVAALAILVLIAVDLVRFGAAYNTTTPSFLGAVPTPGIQYLDDVDEPFRVITMGRFMHNTFSVFGIEDAGGYASVYPKRYADYLALAQGLNEEDRARQITRWIRFSNPFSPMFSLLNVRYLLLPPGRGRERGNWAPVFRGGIDILENRACFPRAFLAHRIHTTESPEDAQTWLRTADAFTLRNTVLLESPLPEGVEHPQAATVAQPESNARIERYEPCRVVVRTKAEAPGLLVLADSFHPGWSAFVDGKPKAILQAYTIFRAVPVPAGNHLVEFHFTAARLKTSRRIGHAAWAGLLLAGIVTLVRTRRRDAQTN